MNRLTLQVLKGEGEIQLIRSECMWAAPLGLVNKYVIIGDSNSRYGNNTVQKGKIRVMVTLDNDIW